MFLDDTIPVLASDYRLLYLPAAPCRFSADGGYVQGCNIELFQRILQVDLSKAAAGDPPALHALHLALSALLLFLVLVFVTGRWTCGWLCPLSTLGDVLSFVRAKLRIPYFKPGRGLLASGLPTGLSLLGIALLMARAFPSLDPAGRFLGCKIPIYPFCKLCPAQQLCPVAAKGPAGYPPVPTTEWAFGFFTVGSLGLLALFLVCFLAARRLWCRFCPMGMISGVFNRGGLVDLVKDGARCNGCGVCAEVCPMEIDTVRSEMTRRNVGCYDCVLCLKCVEHCPRDGCLSVSHAGHRVAESRFR
jgi:ferredoxin